MRDVFIGGVGQTAVGRGGAATVKLRARAVIRKSMSVAQQSVILRVPTRRTVEITMTGHGNVELYTRLGRAPSIYSFDKKAVGPGASKTITFTARAIGGTYYVRTRAMSTTATVTVVARITLAS